jgi:membrane associated rhomboid family serine protease
VVEVLGIESGLIPAVGASGAISGVLGAYLLMFPRAGIFAIIIAFFLTTIRIPALAYIPFWFVLQIVLGFIDPISGVGYLAHIGGFIASVVTGLLGRKRAGIATSTSYYYYR